MDLLEPRVGQLKLDRCCRTPKLTLHSKPYYRNPIYFIYWIQCNNCNFGMRRIITISQMIESKTVEEAKIKFNYLVFCRRVQPFLNLGITLPPQPQREPEPESLFTDIVF